MKITIELDGLTWAELVVLQGALEQFHQDDMCCDVRADGKCTSCCKREACESFINARYDISRRIKEVGA